MVGAGQRGFFTYGAYAAANPEELRFVAVVDPEPSRRERFQQVHPNAVGFSSVVDWLEAGKLAETAIVASPDRHHHSAATGALRLGYEVLLEKPMAASLTETVDLVKTSRDTGRTLAVAHVLRYTPFFRTLNSVVTSGRLGEIVTVEHRENVWAFHMAHSFVRGSWAVAAASTPMIVQKCCHDFDILNWNLDSPVATLTSVGSLLAFTPEHQPPGATERCTDGCPVEQCPYDARRYLNPTWTDWPVHVITDDLSQEGRLAALREGPWGRCVYTAGSDVVDHQVVTMQLESGASVVLVMHGHSAEESRTMRYDGTRATLRARFGRESTIEVTDHATGRTEKIAVDVAQGSHGGGDSGLLAAFLADVETGSAPLTSAAESVESHVLAFAAEEARLSGKTVDVAAYRAVAAGR
ncbi:MAG: Gfo/Idh/MocA family oxidoreductase [Acidimicrobiia bacterium]|nr:Gfo/Idh/MocA family oxidoreductase [Acidimicrobiia bacterium]